MDGPSAQGFLSLTVLRAEGCGGGFAAVYKKGGAAGAAGCVEGLCSLRSGGNDPSGRGLWIALWAMLIKSALRDLLSVSYGIVSILVISRYEAPPYPAAPDFPPSGGQNKTPQNILFISSSQHNGAL